MQPHGSLSFDVHHA